MFRKLPPPTKFTITDKYKLVLGAIALVLGVVILWRAIAVAMSLPAIMVGIAFFGFGGYRLWLGYTRLKQLKDQQGENQWFRLSRWAFCWRHCLSYRSGAANLDVPRAERFDDVGRKSI